MLHLVIHIPHKTELLEIMLIYAIKFEDIDSVEYGVYKSTIDVLELGGVEIVHQSKLSVAVVLAIAAKYGRTGIADFSEETLRQKELLEFKDHVTVDVNRRLMGRFRGSG